MKITKMVKNALLIPKRISQYSFTDTDRKSRSEFEKEVNSLLAQQLPEDWTEFIRLGWTNDFFSIEGKTSSYSVRKIKSYKIGKEFILRQDVIASIKNFIDSKKVKTNEEETQRAEYKRLLSLCSPVLNTEEGVQACVEHKTLEITVKLVLGDNWSGKNVSCMIKRDGTITEPTKDSQNSVFTISQAEAFIEEMKPLRSKLIAVANDIKSKLPKEYFTNG